MKQSDRERQEVVEQHTDCLGPQLRECPVCGVVGLPERIKDHDCQAFIVEGRLNE